MHNKKSKKIKVMVVDDTAFMRKAITEILASDPEIEVVAVAKHGKEAIDIVETIQPDLITLDVDMPVMDGLTTLRHLMVRRPRPVVMISGLADKGNVTFEALRLGAVDFFPKPSGTISLDIHESKTELAKLIKQAAGVNPRAIKRAGIPIKHLIPIKNKKIQGLITVIATQGATAHLLRLLSSISPEYGFSIIAFQDFSSDVLKSYAKEMDRILNWEIKTCIDNTSIAPGRCIVAPTSSHTQIYSDHEKLYIKTEAGGLTSDEALKKLSTMFKERLMNIILGGMDISCIATLKHMALAGSKNIALTWENCVFGQLSKEAIKTNLAEPVKSEKKIWELSSAFMEGQTTS